METENNNYRVLAEGVIDLDETEWLNFYGEKTAAIELAHILFDACSGTYITVDSIDDYQWVVYKPEDTDLDAAEADFHDYLDHLKETSGATVKDFYEFFGTKGWEPEDHYLRETT